VRRTWPPNGLSHALRKGQGGGGVREGIAIYSESREKKAEKCKEKITK